MNGRIKKSFVALLASVLVGASAVAVSATALHRAQAVEEVPVQMSVSLGDTVAVRYLLSLPQGYSAPQMTVNGQTVSRYQAAENGVVFCYTQADVATAGVPIVAEFTAEKNGKREKIGEKEYSLAQYWQKVYESTQSRAESADTVEERLSATAMSTLSATFLQYASCLQDGIELTEAQKGAVYDYDNAVQSRWEKREMDRTQTDGFVWAVNEKTGHVAPTVDYATARLTYVFTTDKEDLSATVRVGGRAEYTLVPERADGVYTLTLKAIKPTEFCEDVLVSVYSGEEEIATSVYSVNRAIDTQYVVEGIPQEEKTCARSLYAYGKACVWAAYASDEAYYTRVPELNDNGIAVFRLFDYVYDDARMLIQGNLFANTEHALYAGGRYYEQSGSAEGLTVSYADGTYTLTLNGASLQTGIFVRGADLHIVVEGDSDVSGSLYRDWDGKQSDESAGIFLEEGKSLRVSGVANKTLTLSGCGVRTRNLTVEGAGLCVNVPRSGVAGVQATGDLLVRQNGELTVRYVGWGETAADGVSVGGNFSVDGAKFACFGFYNGVNLTAIESPEQEGEAYTRAQTFCVKNTAEVAVQAKNGGIVMLPASLTGETLANSQNGIVRFDGGNIRIQADYGVAFADLVLGGADVGMEVRKAGVGYYVGWAFSDGWNWWNTGKYVYASLSSDSADPNVGKLNVRCSDEAVVAFVSGMDINGGTLEADATALSGKGNTYAGTLALAENATVLLQRTKVKATYHSVSNSFFYCVQGGQNITVAKSAFVSITKGDLPVGCWSPANPASLKVNGLFYTVGANASLGDWESTVHFSSDEGKTIVEA